MIPTLTLRPASLPNDLPTIRRLWMAYLSWGNEEMQKLHGVHPHSPRETVELDLASIGKFLPPDGCTVLAFLDGEPCGVGSLRRIGERMGEIKRMYVDPGFRRGGAGRAILERLLAFAREAGYVTVRLDTPDFMTAAHALYRSFGFREIGPYPESEIPDEFKKYLLFMERELDLLSGDGSGT